MERTPAQRQRQHADYRNKGRYAKVNPCYRCGNSAGVDYWSDARSDRTILGYNVGDEALCLCKNCATIMADMTDAEFLAEIQRDDYGKLPQGKKTEAKNV